jgi:RND family efflux transporter MFP subunit
MNAPRARRRSGPRRRAAAWLLAALAGALGAACKEERAAPAAQLPVVAVEAVRFSSAAGSVRAPGVLSRRLETPLAFRTGGVVASVRFREGDAVRRGQVIAALALDEIDARVAQARSALEKARRDLQRAENLHADRVATLEQVEDARTGVEQTQAALRIAEFNRRFSAIEAPADGTVLRRLAEPGQEIAPGATALIFAASGGGWVFRAGVPQADAAAVRIGDAAQITFPGVAAAVPARVTRIFQVADPVTRATSVELEIPEAPEGTRSGAIGTVVLTRAGGEERPEVSLSALVEGNGRQAWVFLLDPGSSRARRVAVEVEAIEDARVRLRTPLAADARVVVVGAEYLRDGAEVRVQEAEASR